MAHPTFSAVVGDRVATLSLGTRTVRPPLRGSRTYSPTPPETVGPEVAGQLLATAGDNPDRLRNEAALAHLCGAAPIPASSGRTDRHRLNRGGDRTANNDLFTIRLCRIGYDPAPRPMSNAAPNKAWDGLHRCLAEGRLAG